jgi:hypothetical protein
MKYTFTGNRVYYNDSQVLEMIYSVEKIFNLENGGCLILLDQDNGELNENIFIINNRGEIVWQVPKYTYTDKYSPFVKIIELGNKQFKLINWDGSTIIVGSYGEIIQDIDESRKLKKQW